MCITLARSLPLSRANERVCVLHCMSKSNSLISIAVCSKVAVWIYVSVLLPLLRLLLLLLLLLPCLSAFISFLIHLWIRASVCTCIDTLIDIWSLYYVPRVYECVNARASTCVHEWLLIEKQTEICFYSSYLFPRRYSNNYTNFFPSAIALLLLVLLLRQPRLPSLLAIIIIILDVCCFILAVILWFH